MLQAGVIPSRYYREYLDWLETNPRIPAGKTTVEIFLSYKEGQTKITRWQ